MGRIEDSDLNDQFLYVMAVQKAEEFDLDGSNEERNYEELKARSWGELRASL